MELLAQLAPKTFWNAQNGSGELFIKIILGLLVSTGIVVALFKTPNQLRRWVITAVTFFSGLFYVLFWIYPTPINRQPDEAPRNVLEGFSFNSFFMSCVAFLVIQTRF